MQAELFPSATPEAAEPARFACPWGPGDRLIVRRRWYTVDETGECAVSYWPWGGATLRACEVCPAPLQATPWVRGTVAWRGYDQAALDDSWASWGRREEGPINDPALRGWSAGRWLIGHADCVGVPREER